MKIRRAVAAMVLLSAAGFTAGQQAEEPQDGRPVLGPPEVQEIEVPSPATDVTWFDGKFVAPNLTIDGFLFYGSNGNVVGTFPLHLGVLNLYGAAGKLYFDAVNPSGSYQGGYQYRDIKLVGMVFPTGFVPSGVAVQPDDTAVFISKSPPSYVWSTKNYGYSSPVISVPYQPSQIDVCPGGNWCIGGPTGLWDLDRNWNINPVPNSNSSVTAVRFCGNTLALGGNGYLDYSLNPGRDNTLWKFTRVTLSFQVNSIDCWQNNTFVGAGSNGSVVYEDPFNNVTRVFQLSPTRNFTKISLAPGRFLNAALLDSQGNLSFNVLASDVIAPAARNSIAQRLVPFTLRNF